MKNEYYILYIMGSCLSICSSTEVEEEIIDSGAYDSFYEVGSSPYWRLYNNYDDYK